MTELWGQGGRVLNFSLADKSHFSRVRLGDPLANSQHEAMRLDDIRRGSDRLHKALWLHHPRILRHLQSTGKQVVNP